jgi:hypothetical protein
MLRSADDGLISPGALVAPLTLSRAQVSAFSTALAPDGVTWAEFGADVPRFNAAGRRLLIEGQRTNLMTTARAPATETVTVTAAAHVLSFVGTGSITLSGVATGTLSGTGATTRVFLSFTPTAGALTLTVAGSVALAQLELGAFASTPILPPAGSPAASTRGTDTLTAPLAALGIGGNGACTLLMSATHTAAIQNALLSVSDGTNNNRLTLRTTLAGNAFVLEGRIAATPIAAVTQVGNPVALGSPWRAALILPGDGSARCVGTAGSTAVLTGGPTSGLSLLRVGSAEGSFVMFGEVAGLSALPVALSDDDAQSRLASLP